MNKEKQIGVYPDKFAAAQRSEATASQDGAENAYRLARLIRSGNRELERQLNLKKTR